MTELTPEILVGLYDSSDVAGDPAPLMEIRRIDWAAVTHAHGPATDIPALLRALMSANPNHRDFANALLFETIWHQGDVYEATPLAVPFLYNLLEAEGPQDKALIAHLLAVIADGHAPKLERCKGNSKEAQEWRQIYINTGTNLELQFAKERRYMAELRQQLARRFELLYPYLREAEPAIRRSVAVAIAGFPEIARSLVPHLNTILELESDEDVQEALQSAIVAGTPI